MEPVTLRTPRLELSVPTAADVEPIYAGCQDVDVQRYTTVPSPYLRSDAEAFIPRAAKEWGTGTDLRWAIRYEGSLAGVVGLHRIAGHTAELGYWLAPASRGKGLLIEAGASVLDFAFGSTHLRIARIEWRAVAGNVASARTGRALGFRYEGTLRQALSNSFGRADAWAAAILATDSRTPQPWPVLEG